MKRTELEECLRASKKNYEQMKVPQELEGRIQQAVENGAPGKQTDSRKVIGMRKKNNWTKAVGAVAACVVFCFTAGLNISETFATEMGQHPVLGGISKVLTFRSYDLADGDKTIHAEIPQIDGAGDGYSDQVNEEILRITADYQAWATRNIAEYKEAFLATGGTEEEFAAKNITVDVQYEVKYESEEILSLVLTANESWSNAYGVQYFYNIDLNDDSEITLKDLLGEEYVEMVNTQIREQIAADDSGLFFEEDMGGFMSISDKTNFYINAEGNPVIVFAKYEIAAGAAGSPEFEIVRE